MVWIWKRKTSLTESNVLSRKSSCKNSDFNNKQQIRFEARCYSCTCVYHEGIRTNGHTAPLFNLGTTWRWINSVTPQPLQLLEKDTSAYRIGDWISLYVWENRLKSFCVENRSTIPRSSSSWSSHYYTRCSDQASKLYPALHGEQRCRIIK